MTPQIVHRRNLTILEEKSAKVTTVADVKKYCPHLSDEQIKELMDIAFHQRGVLFATPSVMIKGSFHVLRLSSDMKIEGNNLSKQTKVALKLQYVYHQKTKESYPDHKSHKDVFIDYNFSKEAMSFAEANWSKSLMLNHWSDYGRVVLQDPVDLHNYEQSDGDFKHIYNNSPKTKAVIHWVTNRSWNEIRSNGSIKIEYLWDKAIEMFTLNPIIGKELQGGTDGHELYHCSRCSEGLKISSCDGCNATFTDVFWRYNHFGRLPENMVRPLKALGLLEKRT